MSTLFTIDSMDKLIVRVGTRINRPDVRQYATMGEVISAAVPDVFALWITNVEDLNVFDLPYVVNNVRHVVVDMSTYNFIDTSTAETYLRDRIGFGLVESLGQVFVLKNRRYLDTKILASGSWTLNDLSEHEFDESLASCMRQFFEDAGVSTVVDFGCGPGAYVKYFKRGGIVCAGYDGNPHTPAITGGTCKVLDLSKPVSVGAVDCVVSLEVGEHIPEEFEITFINNLCSHAKRFIILSWGVPGQDGYGHVNYRTNEYVRELMALRGFASMSFTEAQFRNAANFSWFKNTIMVFTKTK